jgi:hypothetical protein
LLREQKQLKIRWRRPASIGDGPWDAGSLPAA